MGFDYLEEWFVDALSEMVDSTAATLELVVLVDVPHKISPEELERSDPGIAERIGRFVQKRVVGDLKRWRPIDELALFDGVDVHTTEGVMDGLQVGLNDETLETIESSCDVCLHHSVGILTGDILSTTEHGVVGFHHGNLREYRGGPPGFWEFLHGRSETGVTVQKFTETLDGGEIVAERTIDITDFHSWERIREAQHSEAQDLLAEAISRIRDPEFDPVRLDDSELGTLYTRSDRTKSVKLRYLLKELTSSVRRALP
ncbi:formyltransferase family protein [Halorussus caseinilyticus]|uniref:formyltransferase family protein n=1 Tax=Halorussus caseinilyticus TaxID=3034025 RepID=UPI0023E85E8B|nr:formyltransferase family protein [Halorussus sp. DT72]